jgi:hypothetical protein
MNATCERRVSPRDFSAPCGALFWSVPSGCLLQIGSGKLLVAAPDGGGHGGVTEVRDAPAAGAWDLGDQPAHVEPFEEAGDVRTVPAVGRGRGTEEAQAEVAVTETMERPAMGCQASCASPRPHGGGGGAFLVAAVRPRCETQAQASDDGTGRSPGRASSKQGRRVLFQRPHGGGEMVAQGPLRQ